MRVLDVGAGNGAVEMALNASERYSAVSVEYLWNAMAHELSRKSPRSIVRTLASVHTLPFPDASFDAVLCLDALEHFENPRRACVEIARVLRPNGIVLLTTPPRWRYMLRPDPHFGIRGLVALPAWLQRRVAAMRGHSGPHEYVDRIYSSVEQIRRLFPGVRLDAVLSRSRAPRRFAWDAIVLRKIPSRPVRTGGALG